MLKLSYYILLEEQCRETLSLYWHFDLLLSYDEYNCAKEAECEEAKKAKLWKFFWNFLLLHIIDDFRYYSYAK